MPKYLIIGNSAGGIGAAEALRQVDKEGSITIVSDEPYPAYSRPLISEYLAGETSLEGMLFRPPDFYQKNKIDALLGRKATRLDLRGKLLELEGGESLAWERLLLATGGVPFLPKLEGREKEGVFTFSTLDDAKRIRAALDRGQRAVVIGGGLIGMSVTQALTKCGVEVVVVELMDRVLSTILDEEASRLVEGALKEVGVRLVTGQTVKEIVSKPREMGVVGGVVLEDGERIPCNLVIIAIGVAPRIEIVRDTGIEVNRGIVVDRHMATSFPQVYACGDVAEAYDFVYHANRLTPIWPTAYIGGRTAGLNMGGVETLYPGGTAMNALNYFGLAIVSAGVVSPGADDHYEVLSTLDGEEGVYKKIVLRDNLVVGMTFAGDIDRSGIVYALMKDGIDVGGFKDSLLLDGFGLVSFSEELRQERLELSHRERIVAGPPSEEESEFTLEG